MSDTATGGGRTGGGWQWKDVALVALGVAVVGLAALAVHDRAGAGGLFGPAVPEGEAVSVFDVALDREELGWFDILFDKPLAGGRVGEVLESPPATLEPAIGGVWRWRDAGVLRFEPSDRLPAATEITVALIPDRLVGEGQTLIGERELTLVTDRFLVEGVDLYEEPVAEGKGRVFFRGQLDFNYPVDPEELATRARLVDPAGGEPVALEPETTWRNRVVGFRTGAVTKGRDERTLRLVIDGTLTPADGNVALGDAWVHEVPLGSKDRLAVRGVDTAPGERESTLSLRLSSPVVPGIAGRYLSVEPEVPYRLGADRNQLVLTGELRPGQSYTVRLAAGLPAADGATLPAAWEKRVSLPDLPPSVEIQGAGMFLSRSGYRTVGVETVNADRLQVAVDRVYLNNLFSLIEYAGFSAAGDDGWPGPVRRSLGDRLAEETVLVEGGRNRRTVTPLGLDRLVDATRPGLYRVSVSRPGEWRASQRWLLLTDIGLVAKRSEDGFLVWATSFADLAPVAGTRVRLLSDQNQVLAEGRTDAEGLWRVSGLADDYREARPYLVTADRGEDFSFLLLDQARVDTTGLDVSGAQLAAGGYSAFLYGERDLYRPGETVEGLAVVRQASLAPPPPLPVTVRHRDPRGRERGTWARTTDRRGLVELAVELPEYAATGGHTLELEIAEQVVGSYRFQVEEFVPDRIRVAVEPGGAAPVPGGELAWEVAAAYLFGPPAAELPVESRVRLVTSIFAPQGFAGFSFRNDDRSFDDREIFSGDAALGDDGRHRFTTAVPPALAVASSLAAVVTARVSEPGGRGVSARTRLPVHPYPYYLGLRQGFEGYADPGREVAFDWVAVDPEGGEHAAGALRAELFRDRWNTVLRRTPEGTFRYESSRESELVATDAVAAGAARGSLGFTAPEPGAYRVVLTDPETQASTAVRFYASGWGFAPWAIDNPARIEIGLDREEYAPGDVAEVQVRAPFPGRLLLTVERDRVVTTRVLRMSGNTATVRLPLGAELRPNAYVTATLVRAAADVEPGAPGRAFGAVPVAVDRHANRLAVAIEAPDTVRSESELALAVDTAPGAVVTVAVVDEGILRLIAQQTPDPFGFFYRRLALGVDTFDAFSLLLPEVPPQGGPAGGGLAAAGESTQVGAEPMRRVEPVALWSGVLTAGADGRAETRFTLPAFQGAVRVMAVALDGRRFGSAEREVKVRDPLVLLPTFPRFLATGDRAEIPLTVRNDTGREGSFRVALGVTGAAAAAAGAETAVTVADGDDATVYLPLAAGADPGEARLTVTAEGNGETARAEVALPVRPPLPPRTDGYGGALTETATALPGDDAGWARAGTLERTLRIGSLPLVQFSGRLGELLRYPYGCLEQTVSAAFPLLYLEELATELEPDLFDDRGLAADTPAAWVQDAIGRVSSLQLYGGGFGLWPGAETVHPWSTVWATHFLVEARRAGFGVDDAVHDSALAYLAGSVRAKSTYGAGELKRTAYALYVLALAGRADVGTMDHLRQHQAASLDPESRALLAAAYAGAGDAAAADAMAANLAAVERVERDTGGDFDSPLRNRALLLVALLDARPDDPRLPGLVDRLAREAGAVPRWSTQESAFLFLALGRFYRRQAERPPYRGEVRLGDRRLGTFSSDQPAVFTAIPGVERLEVRLEPGYEAGSAYYSLNLRGVPTDEAFRPLSAGLAVERALLDRDGRPADAAAVTQGDLLVLRTRVRSLAGPVENVAVESLLPAGLEIENPRLATTETLPWLDGGDLDVAYADLRDDRVRLFLDLPADSWRTAYALVRAVTPGAFALPPPAAEAMYDPSLAAVGERGRLTVGRR